MALTKTYLNVNPSLGGVPNLQANVTVLETDVSQLQLDLANTDSNVSQIVLDLANTDANVANLAPLHVPLDPQTNSYVLQLSDDGAVVLMNNAFPMTLTVPDSVNVDFALGASILIFQEGAGQVTLTPETNVSLLSVNGLKLSANAVASLTKINTDTWIVAGACTA